MGHVKKLDLLLSLMDVGTYLCKPVFFKMLYLRVNYLTIES